jgi:hypothetical protein
MDNDFRNIMNKVAEENRKKFEEAARQVQLEKEAEFERHQELLAYEQEIIDKENREKEEARLANKKKEKDAKIQALVDALLNTINGDDEGHVPLDKIV